MLNPQCGEAYKCHVYLPQSFLSKNTIFNLTTFGIDPPVVTSTKTTKFIKISKPIQN